MSRAALFLAVSLASSSALADPMRTDAQVEPDAGDGRASTYVALGLQLGGAEDEVLFGGSLDVDYRLRQWVWLHAAGTYGTVPALLGDEDGRYGQIQAGLTARGCSYDNAGICGFVGLDAGARRLTPPFEMTTVDALAVPRIGLDLGGDSVRFRPVLAVPVTRDGDAGWTLTASAAFAL